MAGKKFVILLLLAVFVLGGCAQVGPVGEDGRPLIVKKGTIRTFLCETTPFVFKGRLYRFEAIRAGFINDRVESPDKDYFQIVDQSTGEVSEPFARSYRFGSAFVDGDTVYVTGTNGNAGKQVWIFASKNLKDWQSWKSLDLPGFGMWNTSLCKADDHYAMMMEISKPANQAGVGFTARFAISHDLKNWELTGPECAHTKERYSADGSLRYMDGYYYYFYSEAYDRSGAAYAEQYNTGYRTDVVRSRDMIHWQGSEFNPVLISSPEDEGRIANSELTEEQRGWIAESAMADICNYDIDFCEYKGKVIINYNWGNQRGSDHVAEAVYEGTLEQFIKGWYPLETEN